MRKRKQHERESSLHLTARHHPRRAIIATLLGILSIGVFAAVCISAGNSDGHAGIISGLIGMLCLLIAAVGFILSWFSLYEDNIRPLFPTISSLLNGLLVIFYMLVYIWGTIA